MSPDGSMTVPVPIRSSPRMRVDGCAAGTSAWMYTTEERHCLTSSTEASMNQLPTLARCPTSEQRRRPRRLARGRRREGARQEFLDATGGIGGGLGIIGDGDPEGARGEGLLDVLEHFLLVADDVEVVIGARVLDQGDVGAARLHGRRHLAAI